VLEYVEDSAFRLRLPFICSHFMAQFTLIRRGSVRVWLRIKERSVLSKML
jgi:hypothetical protein